MQHISKITNLLLPFLLLFITSCSHTYPGGNPEGKTFPTVEAESLEGTELIFPKAFSGNPIIVLVGYIRDSQKDIDKWLHEFERLNTPIRMVELPVIQGVVPRLIEPYISNGMRSGIPEKDWKNVLSVYGDAHKVASFAGNRDPLNARVFLLDSNGTVLQFYDGGYCELCARKIHETAVNLLPADSKERV